MAALPGQLWNCRASKSTEVQAARSGYITSMGANDIGVAAMSLGAGRDDKDDVIDFSVGVVLEKKIGDPVQKGDVLAIIHAITEEVQQSVKLFNVHMIIVDEAVLPPQLSG